MKRMAILILCASALPVSAAAETADAPVLRTKWSLKENPKKKAEGEAAVPRATGPALPAPQRLRVPKPKAKQRTAARPAKPVRVNGARMITGLARDKKRD